MAQIVIEVPDEVKAEVAEYFDALFSMMDSMPCGPEELMDTPLSDDAAETVQRIKYQLR